MTSSSSRRSPRASAASAICCEGDALMSPSVEERLARLEDEAQILRTLHDYGRSIDYGDEATFIDCWLTDAVLRWPIPPYAAPFAGHDELRAAFRGHTHAPSVYHKHF